MFTRRLLLVSAVVAAVIAASAPASGKGRTTFVVSGGDLKHSVLFDSGGMDGITGWWWRPGSRVPRLTGWQYQLKLYETGSASNATEWIYVPDASGALPTGPLASRGRADDGRPIQWMAFSPAFNTVFIKQMRASEERDGVLALLAVGVVMLLILTVIGVRFGAMTLWFLRRPGATVVPDSGPVFLYTSVPRSMWAGAGRLGRVPNSTR
jgi:hypothetical protein